MLLLWLSLPFLCCIKLAASEAEELTDMDTSRLKNVIHRGENSLLYFYSKNCRSCQIYQEVFDVIASGKVTDDPTMVYYSIDVDKCPELTMRFMVLRIPALCHVVAGNVYHIENHRRNILDYFSEKKWRQMKPAGTFTHPFGFGGSTLGMMGKVVSTVLSFGDRHHFKMCHWIAASIVATLVVFVFSLLLGYLIADFLFPNQPVITSSPKELKQE